MKGKKRWDFIHNDNGLSFEEKSKQLGLKSVEALRVWVSRNRKRYAHETKIPNYQKFIIYLEKHPNVPFSDVILNRCEGTGKRDRSLVQAVFSVLQSEF